jgi:ferredoxin
MRRTRSIINIDEDKCDGCGLCVVACAESALAIVDGKARLVSDVYCDGLGACLGQCPRGALTVEEREADEYNEAAVGQAQTHHGGCPGSAVHSFAPPAAAQSAASPGAVPPALGNWPVQLRLAPVSAPYYAGATLLICADCVPCAYADFHSRMLSGRTLLIGCPKLDDAASYTDKLARILRENDIAAVEVAFMEVPCCGGLVQLTRRALAECGKQLPARAVRVGIKGEVQSSAELADLPW